MRKNFLYSTLTERGFIEQISHEDELPIKLDREQMTVYAGFDPTSDSLHLGHIVPVMALSHFQQCGHKIIVLVGGATGMVGDPSGRSTERNLLGPNEVRRNVEGLKTQLSRFVQFEGDNPALIVDNNDWISKMSFIDWLREVGKNFTIRYMLGKESVRRRMESEDSLSFTEFAYMTMQAFDFLHLYDHFNCNLQIGGNDQWGNITAGFDLIKKVHTDAEVFGMTLPLISTSSGEKFGKSAGNAVWLDPKRTTPFQFFQYWLQTDDQDVERFLKLFTFRSLADITEICETHIEKAELRTAQRILAEETTKLVHGENGLQKALQTTNVLFDKGDLRILTEDDLLAAFKDAPSVDLEVSGIIGRTIVNLLQSSEICKSRGDSRRRILEGGVYCNNLRIEDASRLLNSDDLLYGKYLVIRLGKKHYTIVRAIGV